MKRKVKGFTLVELIVVMAIFSVIMFGAMSLMNPVSRIMSTTASMESGQAVVSNIGKYLESELSPVEYLWEYNELKDPATVAEEFSNMYYEGVLRDGAVPGALQYGKGQVHVLQITPDCQLKKWDYDVDFAPGSTPVVTQTTDSALSKTYYDKYFFEFLPGSYDSVEEFDKAWAAWESNAAGGPTIEDLDPKETSFTVKATTRRTCSRCGYVFAQGPNDNECPNCHASIRNSGLSFVNVASMALVNLFNRASGAVEGQYFVEDSTWTTDPSDPSHFIADEYIVDRSNPAGFFQGDDPNTPDVTETIPPRYEMIGTGFKVDGSSTSKNGYTFVYSYGMEQDTR